MWVFDIIEAILTACSKKKKNSNSHRKKIVILTVWAANLTQILILRASVILSCALKFKNLPTLVSEFIIMPLFHFISKTQTAFLWVWPCGCGLMIRYFATRQEELLYIWALLSQASRMLRFSFLIIIRWELFLGFQNLCHRIVTITMEYGVWRSMLKFILKSTGPNSISKDALRDKDYPWLINCTTQEYLVNVGQDSHFNTHLWIWELSLCII